MKKVTLCAFGARYSHSNMALHCLKSAVSFDLQKSISILELTQNDRLSYAVEKIAESEPDAVGFSCCIWSIDMVLRAASSIKKILPGCFILLGGPEAGPAAQQLLAQHSFIDMIILGEGEVPFARFFSSFSKGQSILETPSACIRQGKDIITTPQAQLPELDSLPFIYSSMSSFENKAVYYETSRGCPYRCAYCMSSAGNTRFLSLERVQKEFEFLLAANVMRVKLVDRTFNYPASRAHDIFRMLIKLSEKYPHARTNFHFEISACLLTDEILELLGTAKPGLIQLEIGVQSTNEETLRAINRSHDLKKLMDSTRRLCKMSNIHVHTDLIAGLPLEDYNSFAKSFEDVYSLGAEQLQLGFLKVLTGSPMHEMSKEYGIKYTSYPPYEVLKTNVLSYRQLQRLHKIADLVNTLHNSGNFKKTLETMIEGSAFSFFEGFADYAQSNGYFDRPQPKRRLFELLLSYSSKEKAADALLYDWLMNEKPGRLPAGLIPNLPDKEKQRAFFANAENLPHYSALSPKDKSSRCFVCVFEKLFSEETTVLFDYHENKYTTAHKINL